MLSVARVMFGKLIWIRMLTRYNLVAGPIQYDAAVDPEIAKQKIKTHSEVAGQANVCIFPDLNTGNNTYKVFSFL